MANFVYTYGVCLSWILWAPRRLLEFALDIKCRSVRTQHGLQTDIFICNFYENHFKIKNHI
jgi:hypothetical protein